MRRTKMYTPKKLKGFYDKKVAKAHPECVFCHFDFLFTATTPEEHKKGWDEATRRSLESLKY